MGLTPHNVLAKQRSGDAMMLVMLALFGSMKSALLHVSSESMHTGIHGDHTRAE